MKNPVAHFAAIILLMAVCGTGSAQSFTTETATQTRTAITITGIPAHLNGLSCEIFLTVFDQYGWYEYVAWSEPVMVINGSVTIKFFAYNGSEQSKKPFDKNGVFNILVSTREKNSRDLLPWQGYIHGFSINKKTATIPWRFFAEVFG